MALRDFAKWLKREAPAGEPAPFVGRTWTSADGLVLHARDYAPAAGPAKLPVVCIPGLTRNAADFGELAPWIASTRRGSPGRCSWGPASGASSPCCSPPCGRRRSQRRS
jgi:hypothetical protein